MCCTIEHMFEDGKRWTSEKYEAPPNLGARQLCAVVMQRFQEREHADLRLAEAINEWDAGAAWSADGACSAPSWLRAQLGIRHGSAIQLVQRSRRLRTYPLVADAVHTGAICLEQANLILAAVVNRPTYAERDLPVLIKQVSELSYAQGHAVITHWKTLVDAETDPEPDGTTNPPPSEFHVSPGLDSEFEVHGHLDTLDGLTVTTALDSAIQLGRAGDDGPTDTRTAGQKRADALILICGYFLDHHTTRPTSGGQRPQVAVTVDLAVLARTVPGRAIAPRVCAGLDADTARQLCCDTAVTRVITNGRSEVLDVGRQTRVIPTALRTAIQQRDQYCRQPGCDTPAWYSEVHHITHWENGGTTTRTNCALFCHKHHKMLHHGWTVSGDANHTLTFTAPDGTLYHSHPPG